MLIQNGHLTFAVLLLFYIIKFAASHASSMNGGPIKVNVNVDAYYIFKPRYMSEDAESST